MSVKRKDGEAPDGELVCALAGLALPAPVRLIALHRSERHLRRLIQQKEVPDGPGKAGPHRHDKEAGIWPS